MTFGSRSRRSHLFKVEKFQRRLYHPSIKHIYAVLLLTQISYFFANTFFMDHCKT